MNMFLVHLSVADLLTALLTLVPEIAWTLTSPLFHGGDLLCRTIKFLQMLGPYLSSFLLCVTSVDRYRAICRPFKSKHTHVSLKYHWKCLWHFLSHFQALVGAAWAAAIACCLPQVLIFQLTQPRVCYQGMWNYRISKYGWWYLYWPAKIQSLCI